LGSLNEFVDQFRGHKWDDAAKGAALMVVSSIIGGGTEANRTIKGVQHANEGEKKIGFYPTFGGAVSRPIGGTTFTALNGRAYGLGDAAAENLPGIPANQGEAQKDARRADVLKRAAKLLQ